MDPRCCQENHSNMGYVIALAIVVLIVYGIAKAAGGRRYSKMTEEEFETEAKRGSAMGAAIGALQKIINPAHSVEYIQEQQQRVEADGAESGDQPEPGSAGSAREQRDP